MTKRKGFRAFVTRHDALFTVLGAGIVFLGFYVKEGYRDTAKDLASSLKADKTRYEVVNRLDSINNDIQSIRRRLVEVQYHDKPAEEAVIREELME